MADQYIVEITLTHDHQGGYRLPDYFQVLAVPLAGDYADWDEAVPVMGPILDEIIEQETGFGRLCELVVECWPEDQPPERIEFSIEGPDDCAICKALVEADLRSQGKVV